MFRSEVAGGKGLKRNCSVGDSRREKEEHWSEKERGEREERVPYHLKRAAVDKLLFLDYHQLLGVPFILPEMQSTKTKARRTKYWFSHSVYWCTACSEAALSAHRKNQQNGHVTSANHF